MSISKLLNLSFLILLIIPLETMSYTTINMANLLPDDINGWKPESEDRYFNKENLYDYINGGAELYLSYKFNNIISRTYSKADQPDIVVEIFDMVIPENAFGVYSNQRDTNNSNFGQGSQYIEGSLICWKNNFFISIMTNEETKYTRHTIFKLAQTICDSISMEGELPNIVKALPRKGLDHDWVCYFLHHVWQNNYYFISNKNIFRFNNQTEAVMARYGKPPEAHFLLILKYANVNEAQKAFSNFAINYSMELLENEIIQIEDNKWLGGHWSGKLLFYVFEAPDSETVDELLTKLSNKKIH